MTTRNRITLALTLAAMAMATSVVATPSANANLVGLWRFEGDFTDSSDFGNDGTPMGTTPPSFLPGAPLLIVGGQTQAGFFQGGNAHVRVPHHASLNMTTAMTAAAWVNSTSTSWDAILAKNPSNGGANNHAGNYEYRLIDVTHNQQLGFENSAGGVNDSQFHNSTLTVPPATWHHVAVTNNGTTVSFYVDGLLDNTVAAGANFGATNTNPLYIGNGAALATIGFDGLLDDVALFNEVLTAGQIGTIMTGDFSEFLDTGGGGPGGPASIALWSLIGLGLGGFGYYRFRRGGAS